MENRKLVLNMSVSLDGFVAGPDGEMDWAFRTSCAGAREWACHTLHEAGVHIMGSHSYCRMAAFWPYAETPMAAPMNGKPKIVFSNTGLQDLSAAFAEAKQSDDEGKRLAPAAAVLQSWAEPGLASGNLMAEILRLKAQPGNFILAHGGARFARSLAETGQIDEYRLAIHPVVLGKGLPLFAGLRRPVQLRLISMEAFDSGAAGAIYRPA